MGGGGGVNATMCDWIFLTSWYVYFIHIGVKNMYRYLIYYKCMCEHVMMLQILLLCVHDRLMIPMEKTHLYPQSSLIHIIKRH